ncbi:hypothetical protein ACEWY4_017288 [Coilia grayii]|uniref:Ig-like domain-containing protein n=1 Tax=Coilia grayii TaxID=363190 RepID=A0ABD1JHH3_9TELE
MDVATHVTISPTERIPHIPLVSISPPGDIQEGTDVTLTCTSRSHLPVWSYSWYKTGSPTPLQQWSTYTILGITSKHSGGYYCQTTSPCGHLISAPVNLQITEGSRVTLTCSTDANPPAFTYSWYKTGRQTPLSNGESLTFSKIRYDESGKYFCKAANGIGQQDSPAVFLQSGNTNTIQLNADYQNMNPNTTQPDAVYQSLNPNTTHPDAVYHSLNPNTIQPDAVYQSLNPNTTQPDAVYQSLNPNTTQPDAVYQSLNPNTIQPEPATLSGNAF